jgi:hypothetical protein
LGLVEGHERATLVETVRDTMDWYGSQGMVA